LVVEQEAGGQQAQVGRFSFGVGVRGVPRRSKGRVIGLRRRWKALGKKARMKMPRKMTVFLVLVSKGI